MDKSNSDHRYSRYRWLIVFVALPVVMSCAASMPIPTLTRPTKCPPDDTPAVTFPLADKLDTKTTASTVALQDGQVYYVATNGDDDNPGTEAQPFRTIQRAADIANQPGDTVLIRTGTYSPFRIRYSGADDQPITFTNYPGENPLIAGRPDTHGILIQENTSYRNPIGWLVIEGFEIAYAGNNGIKGYNVHHVVIRGCDIHHSHSSNVLLAQGAHHITLDRNRIHDGHENPDHGPHDLYANGNYWTVTNNLFYGTDFYSVQLAAYNQEVKDYIQPGFENLHHWVIANNVFAFTRHRSAFNIWDGYGGSVDDIRISNNIFYKNAESDDAPSDMPNGMRFDQEQPGNIINVSIYNNLHYGQKPLVAHPDGADYEEFDNVDADPHFVATDADDLANNDFHLLPASPAIDAGTAQDAPSHDFDGNPRPHGAGYDIGAYESPYSNRIDDLKVVSATGGDTLNLTITLRWTAPVAAITYTLRSSDTLLTPDNWSNAPTISVPFTASEPGSSERLVTPVKYTGGTLYLALKSQNSLGAWSELSNNAFWPDIGIHLPLIIKTYGSSFQARPTYSTKGIRDDNTSNYRFN